jgi:hypothetical protein
MPTRMILTTAAVRAGGALLGRLAVGRPTPEVRAQDRPPAGGIPNPFERAFPTKDPAKRARDDADYHRAPTSYRSWYPTVSMEWLDNGYREIGKPSRRRASAERR